MWQRQRLFACTNSTARGWDRPSPRWVKGWQVHRAMPVPAEDAQEGVCASIRCNTVVAISSIDLVVLESHSIASRRIIDSAAATS